MLNEMDKLINYISKIEKFLKEKESKSGIIIISSHFNEINHSIMSRIKLLKYYPDILIGYDEKTKQRERQGFCSEKSYNPIYILSESHYKNHLSSALQERNHIIFAENETNINADEINFSLSLHDIPTVSSVSYLYGNRLYDLNRLADITKRMIFDDGKPTFSKWASCFTEMKSLQNLSLEEAMKEMGFGYNSISIQGN